MIACTLTGCLCYNPLNHSYMLLSQDFDLAFHFLTTQKNRPFQPKECEGVLTEYIAQTFEPLGGCTGKNRAIMYRIQCGYNFVSTFRQLLVKKIIYILWVRIFDSD